MLVPWIDLPESCTWQCHIDRHNADLGDDFPMEVGTAIPAPFNGTVTHQVRAEPAPYRALYIVYIQSDEDSSLVFEFMHASHFEADGHYLMGQTIMLSGGARLAVGSGRASGPHLHANARVNGKLTPVRTALSEFASVGPVVPIAAPTEGDEEMQFILDPTTKNTDGKSPLYWALEGGVRRKFTGTGAQASAFVTFWGITTKTPDAATWAAICAAYPIAPAGDSGPTAPGGVTAAAVQAISDASDKKILAAIDTVPAAVVKAEASALGNG